MLKFLLILVHIVFRFTILYLIFTLYIYLLLVGYDSDHRSDVPSRYYPSQQTISLATTQADQREREAEELRALERYYQSKCSFEYLLYLLRDIVDLNEIFKDVAVSYCIYISILPSIVPDSFSSLKGD